jgi:hypothetical protein
MPPVRRYLLLFCVIAGCKSAPPPAPPPAIDFRAELSPYGEWIVVAPYGRLWHPNPRVVGEKFVPYFTGGQWVLGKEGWSFKSKWAWGDFVFHYGRWVYVADLDWLWSMDPTYGLAFVNWKSGDTYVGWAPIPPIVRGGDPPQQVWTYVRARHFAQPQLNRFALSHDEAVKAPNEVQPAPATGPAVQVLLNEGGLTGDAKTGYRVPEIPVPAPEPVAAPVEAPPSAVEVVTPAQPEPPPKKTKKKKKHH